MIKNIRIVKGRKGVFLGMPSNKNKRGEYVDIFFPINQQARNELTKLIFEEFQSKFPDLVKDVTVYIAENDYAKFSA